MFTPRSLVALAVIASLSAHAAPPPRADLLLAASFDGKLDADHAVGDPKLYSAPSSNRAAGVPGLPEGGLVQHAKGEGRFGDALRFTKRMKPVVFFRGEKNLGYNTTGWSGSCSVWLKLDPDQDLEPGYCDPLQFVGQAWDEGNMFIEFSKDHTPRHFRYALRAVTTFWNPTKRGWEEIPENERPMVAVHKPPFSRERWTHVVFTFTNVNSGKADSVGKLYLDGQPQGSFQRHQVFNWEEPKSAITLGLSYVGLLDELAIFKRALTDEEVRALHASGEPAAAGK